MQKVLVGFIGLLILAACSQQSGSLGTGAVSQRGSVSCNNISNNPIRLDRYFNPCKGYLQVAANPDSPGAIAVHSDNSIALVVNNSLNWKIYRYSSDGTSLLSVTPGQSDNFRGLALQSDGKAIAMSATATGWTLRRFNINGTLDTTFAFASNPPLGLGWGPMVVQPDNKILVAGQNSYNQLTVARYTPNGQLDPSFNATGYEWESVAKPESMALAPDGKIVLTAFGSSTVGSGGLVSELVLVRINPNGGLDQGFGAGGLAVDPRRIFTNIRQIAVQPDGKILVAAREDTGISQGYLLRFEASGAADTSFANNGELLIGPYGLLGFVLRSDGKIVVQTVEYGYRYFSNGAVDPSGYRNLNFDQPLQSASVVNYDSMVKLFGSDDRIIIATRLLQIGATASFPFLIRLQN